MKIPIGNFTHLQDAFIRDSFIQENKSEELLAVLKDKVKKEMESEVIKLVVQLNAINKTIENKKKDVKSKVSEVLYSNWIKRINGLDKRFKQKFSNENNGLYDYHFKMNKHYGNDWNNIKFEFESLVKDIGAQTIENNNHCHSCKLKKKEKIDESLMVKEKQKKDSESQNKKRKRDETNDKENENEKLVTI